MSKIPDNARVTGWSDGTPFTEKQLEFIDWDKDGRPHAYCLHCGDCVFCSHWDDECYDGTSTATPWSEP